MSPVCLGMVREPALVTQAFRRGLNFFFVTADMHWPLYEPLRQGLRDLLRARPSARRELVVAAASYVTQPEFCYQPFEEVLEALPELGHLDVAVIGGSYAGDFLVRLAQYRKLTPGRMRAVGCSFHDRAAALSALRGELVDLAFVRYNAGHPGAEFDLFNELEPDRHARLFTFQSMHGYVSPARLAELKLPSSKWRPEPADHYRFALSVPEVDGILCSLSDAKQLASLERALRRGPLNEEERHYLGQLSALDQGRAELAAPGQ